MGARFKEEVGVTAVSCCEWVYLPEEGRGDEVSRISLQMRAAQEA
jgi:hypothetical protein